jgi:protein arginine kinase activator
MLCDICHKNTATVHLTEIISDKVVEMHICQSCAKEKADENKEQLSITQLLSGLTNGEQIGKEKVSIKCQFCGLTYADFRKKARLGCANCYSTFRIQLMPLLKKIHSSIRYVGKIPLKEESASNFDTKLKELKARLNRAVQLEEYEDAARLRDELKKLEKDA